MDESPQDNWIRKIGAALALLQAGKAVSDPAKWKRRQIASSLLVALIWAAVEAARAFGYPVEVGSETVDAVAVGLLALINWLLTVTTTEKIGLPARPAPDLPRPDAGA